MPFDNLREERFGELPPPRRDRALEDRPVLDAPRARDGGGPADDDD